MEAESTIPGTVMQVARIYADYAASRGGRSAGVSYPVLIRQTHRSRDALVEAHDWMTTHGWLRLRPGKDGEQWRDGQRKSYDLTIGHAGTFTNGGTLEAINHGELILIGETLSNSGTMEVADSGSTIDLVGVTISGAASACTKALEFAGKEVSAVGTVKKAISVLEDEKCLNAGKRPKAYCSPAAQL